jgi:GNAT superfamily N-acetyltransferase
MRLTYRDFTGSDAQYEELLQIENDDADEPKTLQDLRDENDYLTPEQTRGREFVMLDGKCVGASNYYSTHSKVDGCSYCGFFTLLKSFREHRLEQQIIERLMEVAKSGGAAHVLFFSDEADEPKLHALKRLAFEPFGGYAETRLDLDLFDPKSFDGVVRRVGDQGIDIRSSIDLEGADLCLVQKVYELATQLRAELDPDDTSPSETFDAFRERILNPKAGFPQNQFLALDGNEVIGLSRWSRSEKNLQEATTDLTGVLVSHRRRGIAKALKVVSLTAAKQEGIRFVSTFNTIANPMLQLNYQLGFQDVDKNPRFRRTLD